MYKIAILIINHETPTQTQELVNHITSHMCPGSYDLTVVDNSKWFPLSTADIKNSRNEGFDQVVINWLKTNRDKNYLGYWTLNSDCILKDVDYTSEIIKYLNKDSNIGLLSTLIHEKKAPGWGDDSPLQNPQNIHPGVVSEIGYIDFQSAIISRNLLNKFAFNNDLVYYLGGLDMDFNLCCEKWGYKKVILPHLEMTHLGAQSYREQNGDLVTMKIDMTVEEDQRTHIKRFHLEDEVRSGNSLMAYGIRKRYDLDIIIERNRMINLQTRQYQQF